MAAYKPRYLQKVKISRGPRTVGEVFAMQFKGVGYIFGRIIRDDCAVCPSIDGGPWPKHTGHYLVYIYKDVSHSIEIVPHLSRERLMTPPMILLGHSGWSMGYFVKVRGGPLKASDVLSKHCFYFKGEGWFDLSPKKDAPYYYFNEYGRRLSRRYEPCKPRGAGGYGAVENYIARALGLPHEDLREPWEP